MRYNRISIALLAFMPSACANLNSQYVGQVMTFFVTSSAFSDGVGLPTANFGGIEPADKKCRDLASAAGDGTRKTWRAYLSYHAGAGVGNFANARDRIGQGPWYNYAGKVLSPDLHTLHTTSPAADLFMTEKGEQIPANEYIMTGTDAEGILLFNCNSYSRSDSGGLMAFGLPSTRWNYVTEVDCQHTSIQSLGSKGRFYCFAAD